MRTHSPRRRRHAALALALLPATAPAPPGAAGEPPAAVEIVPAPPPAEAAELAAWHRRYRRSAAPVKAALARLLGARREERPALYRQRVRSAARGLAEALEASPVPLPEGDRAARFLVRRTYFHLARAAAAGAEGHFEAMELELGRAAAFLAQAARVLERYGLAP